MTGAERIRALEEHNAKSPQEWIEVETNKWKDQSQMILSETSGFQKPKSWGEMDAAERKAARDRHQESFEEPEGWEKMMKGFWEQMGGAAQKKD